MGLGFRVLRLLQVLGFTRVLIYVFNIRRVA